MENPPDKIVLVASFDQMASVAEAHFPTVLVRQMLKDNRDNVAAFAGFTGPIDIFAAKDDEVILMRHAKAFAASVPGSRLVVIDGGHNDYSYWDPAKIRNP
jgi:pimeloyl-ACP methyl ester carboxylesterase